MEEAVERGIAAFSESESEAPRHSVARPGPGPGHRCAARRPGRGIPGARLPAGGASWARQRRGSAQSAGPRWRNSMRSYGHFLDTNGPYRLESWSPAGVVLQAFPRSELPPGRRFARSLRVPLRAYATTHSRIAVTAGDPCGRRPRLPLPAQLRASSAARWNPGTAGRTTPRRNAVMLSSRPAARSCARAGRTVGGDGRYAVSLEGLPGPGHIQDHDGAVRGGKSRESGSEGGRAPRLGRACAVAGQALRRPRAGRRDNHLPGNVACRCC